jgi:hypothetical protein
MFQTLKAPMTNSSSAIEVNKVYKTNDLLIFKPIDGNRVPNLQHIKRLSDSIRIYGMKCNPILVNEKMEVIDGQHRLMAAKESKSFVYYIIVDGYSLNEVHTLNLNQKNWAKKDFMEGYANMGIESYIKLSKFIEKNDDFGFSDCVSMCSNRSGGQTKDKSYIIKPELSKQELFEDGTWRGKDFELAQDWANKIRMVQTYYSGYNRSTFVGTMIGLLQNINFDFNEFMHKLRLQPTALVDCANREQYRTLIEDIYNWRSRQKINLRY